ncbi:YmfQ family protein [Rhizobium sp. A37_96]
MASGTEADMHVRRTQSDYQQAMADNLPTGPAWPREPDALLMKVLSGLASSWALVDARAADLLEIESDPRITSEMLDSWEAAWGLPDPCVAEAVTIADRRLALVQKMTSVGGQSIPYFEGIARDLGYTINIQEHAPYMAGVSGCGDTRTGTNSSDYRWELGPASIRFQWTVNLTTNRETWFRTGLGGGEVGVDRMVTIGLATDLECVLRRWHPAHTEIAFNYSIFSTVVLIDSQGNLLTDSDGNYLTGAF